MKKFKSIASYVLVGTIICLLASPYTVSAAGQLNEAISLEKALDLVTSKSIEIKLLDEKITNAQNRLSYAVRNADIKKNDSWITDQERADLKTQVELEPVQKRNTVQVLKLQKAEKINTLKMDITKAYFTYLFTQEEIENQTNAIERLQKKLEIVKTQVSAGIANKAALTSIEVGLKTAEQQYSLLSRNLSNTSMNLNSLLGRPINSVLELTNQDIPIPNLNINLEQLIDKKNTESSQLLKALNAEAEAKIKYDIANFSSLKVIPDGIEQAETDLLNASFDYKKLLSNQECDVLNEYNNLLNLKDDVDINKLKADVSDKEMKKAKAEYDLGLIDIIKYNNAIQSDEDSVTAYKKAQLDYFVAAVIFEN